MLGALLIALLSGGLAAGGVALGNIFRKDISMAQLQSNESVEMAQLKLSYDQLAWDKMAMMISLLQNNNSGGRNDNLPLLLYMMGAFGATSPGASSGSSDGSKDSAQNTSGSNSTINQPTNSYDQNKEVVGLIQSYNTVNQAWLSEHAYLSPAQIDSASPKTMPVWETKADQITTYRNTSNPQELRRDEITQQVVVYNNVNRFLNIKNL